MPAIPYGAGINTVNSDQPGTAPQYDTPSVESLRLLILLYLALTAGAIDHISIELRTSEDS